MSKISYLVEISIILPDATPDQVQRQFKMAQQLVLQSWQSPGINIQ